MVVSSQAMAARRSPGSGRKARRATPQQIIFTVIGLLVILTFILGMLRYGALANALEAQRLGAQAYLLKPLDFAEVNQWIQRCLAGLSSIKI